MSGEPRWAAEVEAYLAALARGDRRAALAQVAALSRAGHDVLTVIQRLLVPAQLRVGELWVTDAWSVAQEHAATAVSESVIGSLALGRQEQSRPDEVDGPALVVSCVEQEWHALPALMVSEHLRAAGFAVHYLGANASAQGLVRHVHEIAPAAVLLSCSLPTFLPLVRHQVEAIRETGTPVVVGGSAFDPDGHRARTLGATAYAGTAQDAAAVV
ncbi:MAG: cobalamin-dependent protein, partial [Nocardioidaceae bacterium]